MFLGAGSGGSFLTGGGGGGSQVYVDFVLFGPAIHLQDEYWRLVTYGFLHSGLLHIGFNMYILYWLGTMLEPSLGHVRFVALYFASLLAGAFGALLLDPNAATVGASGAVFGLMAAAFVMQRARGIDPMAVRHRPDHPDQPRARLRDPERLDRRPHRRPRGRRHRGVR